MTASPCGIALAQSSLRGDTEKPVPALSLESLYHPTEKYDFDGSLPSTHWVGQADSQLLIRRSGIWNEVDLATGNEAAWHTAAQIQQRLAELDGVTEKQAKSAAGSAVSKMKEPGDTVLVRIGKSLAAVSAAAPARWLTRDASAWKNATLDPTARRVAYTRDGDLFVVDAATDRSLRLTNDGEETLLDGILDWTYQEEIFGRGNFRGFWFSADGDWLAMLRIDISAVEPYTLAASSSQRGKGVVSRYPKAGDPIPHAELLLWDLREFDSGEVPAAKRIDRSTPQDERIITGVWWYPDRSKLLYCISDRRQTWRELRLVEAPMSTGLESASQLLIREESPAWVEPPSAPGWLSDGSLIWLSNLPAGRSRLFHLSAGGRVVTPLTPADFDVRSFVVRSDGSQVMVTGDAERGTIERHVYRAASSDAGQPQLFAITESAGWHRVSFSPDGKWFVDRQSTPRMPPTLSVQSATGDEQIELASSKLKLTSTLVKPEIFRIETSDGVQLPAMLFKPSSATAQRRCPVVIEVYGGPQAPVVSARWSGTKALYRELLARRGIATLVIDNRSSAGRGIADSWAIRHRVGEIEFKDLMTGVDWLQKQDWVDPQRLAIRGWSFGGFMTLFAMTHSDAFTAGIAGGSVTDWREYDAFYTERYMGLPSENEDGYRSTAPVLAAEKLAGTVLLIHGESDDNVHPSGTMRMARALQHADKKFQLMIYPGAAHAVHHPKQVWHMVQMTDRFLISELLGR